MIGNATTTSANIEFINTIANWGPFVVGVITLVAIIFYNQRSIKRMEQTAEHMEEQAESLSELSSEILTPSIDCRPIEHNSEEIKINVKNSSGVEFVMRAVIRVNEEPIRAKFWNDQDANDFLDGDSIAESQLIKWEPARLYPELPLAASRVDPGGPWATLIRPGETRTFSTKPHQFHKAIAKESANNIKDKFKDSGQNIEEFEEEIGMNVNAETRFPDLLENSVIENVEGIKFIPINPTGVNPYKFTLGDN